LLKQIQIEPAQIARRWEVVIQRSADRNDHVKVVRTSSILSLQDALLTLEIRREWYETKRTFVFEKSLDWAYTYEGESANGRRMVLYIRPHLESAN
jgi:hypothetical protein